MAENQPEHLLDQPDQCEQSNRRAPIRIPRLRPEHRWNVSGVHGVVVSAYQGPERG